MCAGLEWREADNKQTKHIICQVVMNIKKKNKTRVQAQGKLIEGIFLKGSMGSFHY